MLNARAPRADDYRAAVVEQDRLARLALDDPSIEVPTLPPRPDFEAAGRRAMALMDELETAERELRTTLAAKAAHFTEQLASEESALLWEAATLVARLTEISGRVELVVGDARESKRSSERAATYTAAPSMSKRLSLPCWPSRRSTRRASATPRGCGSASEVPGPLDVSLI